MRQKLIGNCYNSCFACCTPPSNLFTLSRKVIALMNEFKNLIVLGPLVYAIHHFEEHVVFNFIEWKVKYFWHSAASMATEAILSILTSILIIFALLHLVKNSRASALVILFILFTTQVINVLFHLFFSLYYNDFSPGVVTGLFLYLPANFFIVRAAFKENFLESYAGYGLIALLGTVTFVMFEIFGSIILGLGVIASCLYFFWFNKRLIRG